MNKKDKNSQSIGKVFKYQFGNLISMPMIAPSNTNAGEKQREVLSYIPITDVAVDMEKAALNPTKTNVVNAGTTIALNALGAKYLKYLTKGSKEIKQMAKVAKDKYDELIKLLNKNRNSVVRSRSTREEATRLGNQAQSALSDYYAYNRAANIQKVPEYFVYSIWPFADAGINYAQNSLENKKQGGKMNILEFLKNGSGIHIKKKNRGKFTSYCGGKVTDECIQKGKNSSNPAIRKRATFADNARHFKHKDGGIIKAGFGQKLSNTVNKIGDFFNSNTGKGLLNLGMQAFGTIKGSIDANNYSSSFDAETNSQLKAMDASQRKNNYKQASQLASEIIKQKQQENPDIHYGPIDKQQLENQIADSLYDDSEMIKYQTQRAQEKQKQMEAIQGSSSGILDTVGGLLGNFIGNKKDTSTNTSSNNSTFGNYVSTQFKNYGTFNSDGSMNLGNGLGTISINEGYKPRKFGTLMNYT